MAVPDSKANVSPASPSLQNAKSFAEVAIERGYCSADQISKARTQQRSDGSKDLRHAITGIAREARHSLSRSLQSKPFETVTNSFPDRTHGAIVNIVRPRGE